MTVTTCTDLKPEAPRNSCLKKKQGEIADPSHKKRRLRVTFAFAGHEEIEAPLPGTPRLKEGRSTFEDQLEHAKPRGRTASRREEDRARANLNRLLVNHRRVKRTCSCGNGLSSSGWRRSLNSFALVLGAKPMRHIAIDGDIMLMGHEKGIPEAAILLAGANVFIDGVSVAISNEGAPTTVQTFDTREKAREWASKVKVAADLWEDSQTLAEAALKQKSLHHHGGSAGGTWGGTRDDVVSEATLTNEVFRANDLQEAQIENLKLKEEIESLLARVEVATMRAGEAKQVAKAPSSDIFWVEAVSNTTSGPPTESMYPTKDDGVNSGSLWRCAAKWMPSLFRDLPIVLA